MFMSQKMIFLYGITGQTAIIIYIVNTVHVFIAWRVVNAI